MSHHILTTCWSAAEGDGDTKQTTYNSLSTLHTCRYEDLIQHMHI